MSIIAAPIPAAVSLPASVSKVITGVNCAGIIKSVLPAGFESGSFVKPRDISMSHETARAAIGAKTSPKAVIVGLSYLTLAYAYGQGKPEVLSKDCPQWAVHGLAMACDLFKAGAGNVTVDALSVAIQTTVDKLLALPKPIKTKAVNAPAVVGAVETTVEGMTETAIERRNISADIADKRASESLLSGVQSHVDAIVEAENKARELANKQQKQEGVDVVRLVAEMADKDQALEMVKEMALAFGYKLAKIPAKKAA